MPQLPVFFCCGRRCLDLGLGYFDPCHRLPNPCLDYFLDAGRFQEWIMGFRNLIHWPITATVQKDARAGEKKLKDARKKGESHLEKRTGKYGGLSSRLLAIAWLDFCPIQAPRKIASPLSVLSGPCSPPLLVANGGAGLSSVGADHEASFSL